MEMTLGDNQRLFAKDVGKLLVWIYEHGYAVTLGEAQRTPEMAAIYAKDGRGIADSLHILKLAIDLNLFKDGKYLGDTESHRPLGEFWESLDIANRWGGRFKRPDGNHYERNFNVRR